MTVPALPGVCRYDVDATVKADQTVQATLQFDDGELTVTGRVVRVSVPEEWVTEVAVQFTGIRPADADRIRKHLFAEQLRLRALHR
jgi:hypothetical protein